MYFHFGAVHGNGKLMTFSLKLLIKTEILTHLYMFPLCFTTQKMFYMLFYQANTSTLEQYSILHD